MRYLIFTVNVVLARSSSRKAESVLSHIPHEGGGTLVQLKPTKMMFMRTGPVSYEPPSLSEKLLLVPPRS